MLEQKVNELIKQYKNYKVDGKFTLTEIFKFTIEVVSTLVDTAESLVNKTGEDKKKWVCASIKQIYMTINPDIPKVPNFIETPIENFILDHLVPPAIDALVNFMNNKGIFKHK